MVRSLTRREQYLEAIRKFRLMDDDFMSKVFDGSPECTEHVLRILLERDDIHVVSVKTQYDIIGIVPTGRMSGLWPDQCPVGH